MRAADFTKMVEGIVPNTNNVMGEFLKSNNIKFDLRGERACTMGRMEFGFHGDHFFFFPNGRNTTNYSVYQVHKRHANRVGEINYNKEIENKLPPFTIPWFRQWAIEKMSDRIVYENIRQYVYNWAKTTLQKEGGLAEGLTIDVPNEEWLQDKIDYAKSKGRDQWGAPFFGSTTAYARPNPQVSVVRLEMLKGMRNEQNTVRKKDLEWLMAYMEKTGKLPPDPHGKEYAPYIMVAYNGEAWVNEGNHRIMAAFRLGWKKMPIEIKYFDGGERVESGIMYPGKIGL